MSDEIKVIIVLKGDRGSVGVQSPNCDPVFATMQGGLDAILQRVPGLVAEARQRWAETPRYPKCESPLPSQTAPRGPQTPTVRTTPQRQPAAASPQQKLL